MTSPVWHKNIRRPVLAVWAGAWIAFWSLAFWMNGGFTPVPGRLTLIPASLVCGASAIFAALVASSARVQALVLLPDADVRGTRRDLGLIALITGALSVEQIVFMSLGTNG